MEQEMSWAETLGTGISTPSAAYAVINTVRDVWLFVGCRVL